MAIEKINADRAARRCRCAATASTPIGSSRRDSCASVSFDGLEEHLFEDDRIQADAGAPGTPSDLEPARIGGSAILLVNANFGCGSSREHAPQAIRRWGIRAVVGESFSEIFFGNSVALGLPCVSASHADMERLMALVEGAPATVLSLDIAAETISGGGMTAASRCRRRRASRFSKAPGTRPACCSIASRKSKPWRHGCRT